MYNSHCDAVMHSTKCTKKKKKKNQRNAKALVSHERKFNIPYSMDERSKCQKERKIKARQNERKKNETVQTHMAFWHINCSKENEKFRIDE